MCRKCTASIDKVDVTAVDSKVNGDWAEWPSAGGPLDGEKVVSCDHAVCTCVNTECV